MATTFNVVNSASSVATLIDSLSDLPADPPSLYVDLEGVNLSREGSISLVTLLVKPGNVVLLIDVHTLHEIAFTTPGTGGKTLRDIFECPTIPKVFFDVRNDSDGLYAHYGIALQGIQDVQLMEKASRWGLISRKKFVNGLARCYDRDAPIPLMDKLVWKEVKQRGEKLFSPERGGSYEVFNARPLTMDITAYCANDVLILPTLHKLYWDRLTPEWKRKVEDETRARVRLSQHATYQPHGREKAFGPWQNQ